MDSLVLIACMMHIYSKCNLNINCSMYGKKLISKEGLFAKVGKIIKTNNIKIECHMAEEQRDIFIRVPETVDRGKWLSTQNVSGETKRASWSREENDHSFFYPIMITFHRLIFLTRGDILRN